jgi:hypothetical protein
MDSPDDAEVARLFLPGPPCPALPVRRYPIDPGHRSSYICECEFLILIFRNENTYIQD